ncbi:hypothetical protein HPULCUR_004057 [Helicostylum pulchrum]|uniref:Uncharacterized protein n=1 Tax=Helicostylum pulchrum TaxID=562976 RepID=A0ABP9XX82_9FUNG
MIFLGRSVYSNCTSVNIIEPDDRELQTPPSKKHNRTIPSDRPLVLKPLAHLNERSSSVSNRTTEQHALNLEHDSIHKYSLERLGIIQCGHQVECWDLYPDDLYNLLVDNPTTMTNPVSNNAEYFDPPSLTRRQTNL